MPECILAEYPFSEKPQIITIGRMAFHTAQDANFIFVVDHTKKGGLSNYRVQNASVAHAGKKR